jgi:hypothetical protein
MAKLPCAQRGDKRNITWAEGQETWRNQIRKQNNEIISNTEIERVGDCSILVLN